MKALVKNGHAVEVRTVPSPQLSADTDIIVQVELAGLCRTDLYVAEGRIKACDPLVLGHEFAGTISSVGAEVEHLRVGDRITVNPLISCSRCRFCLEGMPQSCQNSTFIGITRQGCFAEYITVPSSSAYVLPDNIPFAAAAYAEPVAASLAVLKTGIRQNEHGIIYGCNRFSQLLQKILAVHGYTDIIIFDPDQPNPPQWQSEFDFVIETALSSESLRWMVEAVRPGGKIILKSRQYEPIVFQMIDMIKKEPVLHVVNYGPFEDAVALLASGKISIDDLIDGIYTLDRFQDVLSKARLKESLKPFFAPCG